MTSEKISMEINSRFSDFTLISSQSIPEYESTAYVFRHTPTNSSLLWLANDDINKAFAMAFKTPPIDNTGVFHILEHSVLDGSKKYPVKEPFVNLLKSSMQTFLNALTFSDKTMYPVASTNMQDLKNLISVYMDAAFFPLLLEKDHIFSQEGWHLETNGEKEIGINGVVYNEMKGALSDPEDLLLMHLKKALFPDSTYGFESGGNPAEIPTLTLEAFRDAHRRHYTLQNAHVILYGDYDIASMLAFLSQKYQEIQSSQAEKPANSPQGSSWGEPNPLVLQTPVTPEPVCYELATTPENATTGAGFVIGSYKDREKVLATHVLLDAIMGSNEAPLKKHLLEANLGSDVEAYVLDGIAQPFVVFEVKGAHKGSSEAFLEALKTGAKALVNTGIDSERLEAAISQMDFSIRERDFTYPDGVAAAIEVMSSWLYDEKMPTAYLTFQKELSDLSNSVGLGIFEKLLSELVLENPHTALVSLETAEKPSAGLAEAQDCVTAALLQEASFEEVAKAEKHLQELQTTPDTPEALATLPALSLEDITEGPAQPIITEECHHAISTRNYHVKTHGILYTTYYFDLKRLSFEELPYVGILVALLGKLDTRHHTAEELDTLVSAQLGTLAFSTEVFADISNPAHNASPKLLVEAAALQEKIAMLAELPAELFEETIFDDTERIYNILLQQKTSLEQHFTVSGHSVALNRAACAFSEAAGIKDQLSGVSFYRFLSQNLERWEKRKLGLCEVLRNISARIFKANGCTMSFCGAPKDVEAFWKEAGDLGLTDAGFTTADHLIYTPPLPTTSGLTIQSNVCYVAQAGETYSQDVAYDASWIIASKALTYSYLWNEVRVLGGAYGAGMIAYPSSLWGFYSYRDPAVAPTLARYAKAATWLSTWTPQTNELAGYIISSVASLDAPQKPKEIMRTYDALFYTNRKDNWIKELRERLLVTTLEDVYAFAHVLMRSEQNASTCIMGPQEKLAQAGSELTIENLL